MATTNTEIYRRFDGKLGSTRFGSIAIASSGIRASLRKKVPLLLFYLPPFISTMIFSFIVYAQYMQIEEAYEHGDFRERLTASMAARLLQTRELIVQFNIQVRYFALLTIAWYGSGLLAEDRKYGAHLLYFARPISRFGYFLGKLGVVLFHGALTLMVPVLIICLIAVFNSPDWVFLREDWPLILRSIAYALVWMLCVGSLVLACSSLTDRRAYALAGVFGFVMLTSGIGGALAGIYDDLDFFMISLLGNFQVIGAWLFDSRTGHSHDQVALACWIVGGLTVLCFGIVALRLRRMEVLG